MEFSENIHTPQMLYLYVRDYKILRCVLFEQARDKEEGHL